MKIVAVIPTHNEESTIGGVVESAKKHVHEVIVVDNRSTDATRERAKSAGAEVIHQPILGAGIATKSGLEAYKDSDIKVTLDGDGQHDPNEIPRLLNPILYGEADLVIGSRFLKKGNIPAYRTFGIKLITWLYNLGYSDHITDAQSCFRAYSRKLLDKLTIEDYGFGFSVETLIKARKMGFRIAEVPITCLYHEDYKQNSEFSPLKHGLLIVYAIIKWRVKVRS